MAAQALFLDTPNLPRPGVGLQNHQLPNLQTLDLAQVSKLSTATRLDLGVPGTYTSAGTCVRILQFRSTLQIIKSKQRPRKIQIEGEDGSLYYFLLKGHEDLRQDERAMQVLGLVNSLLANDRRTANNDLSIQRYAVIPVSPSVGLRKNNKDNEK